MNEREVARQLVKLARKLVSSEKTAAFGRLPYLDQFKDKDEVPAVFVVARHASHTGAPDQLSLYGVATRGEARRVMDQLRASGDVRKVGAGDNKKGKTVAQLYKEYRKYGT